MTTTDEFAKLLDLALAEASESTNEQIRKHGLDGLAGWSLAEAQARLLFGDPKGRYAIMAAQAVGLHDPASQAWRWAWNDPTFPPHLVQAANHVRDWGKLNGIALLTEPTATLDDATAFKLAAFAARLVGWPGIYRGVGGPKVLYIAFAPTLRMEGGPDRVEPIALQPPRSH